jgi:hypothetical protein
MKTVELLCGANGTDPSALPTICRIEGGRTMSATNVASIVAKELDSAGAMIETVYAKVVPRYAVYRTAERVIVQYADDDKLGSDQRQALIASNPVKGEINGLIDGWRKSKSESAQTRARLFDRRVADALVVGLQGDPVHAVDLLNQIKADIIAERTSIARTSYLFTSCATTAAFALIFGLIYSRQAGGLANDSFAAALCLSAAVGALGAFFSIALAIRGRQIGTDLQWRDNHTDAGLRVTIGAISGAVLYCLLHAKIVTLGFGDQSIGSGADSNFDVGRALLLVTAFAAGFTERLVGDLLGRAVLGTTASANPLAGKAPVQTTVATAGKAAATEANPLGKATPAAAMAAGAVAELATAPPDADDLLDGCLDHAALGPDELTRDVELPEAMGGVAGRT